MTETEVNPIALTDAQSATVNQTMQMIQQAGRVIIVTEEDYSKAADVVKYLSQYKKKLEEVRTGKVGPLNQEVKTINTYFKVTFTQPIDVAKTKVTGMMTTWALEEKTRQEEAEAIRRKQAEDEALKLAESAQSLGQTEAADKIMEAVPEKTATKVRTTGAHGSSASIRSEWKWRVGDIKQIPREYLEVNKAAVTDVLGARRTALEAEGRAEGLRGATLKAYVNRALGAGQLIPGIEIYLDERVQVR